MTTLATADLRTQVETAIWRLMTPPAEGGLGLTLRAATIRLASLTYRRALDSGRTPERRSGMKVWILTRGEAHEGGDVLGVYADKHVAFVDFAEAARQIHDAFELDDIDRRDDGSVHVAGGSDWLSLEPHEVRDRPQIGAGR